MASRAHFESMRTLGFAAISGSYAALGAALTQQARAFCITNNTQGDMIISLDSTDSAGNIFLARGSYKLWDIQQNMNAQYDDRFVLSIGDQFYIKQVTAPVSGDVYLELLY